MDMFRMQQCVAEFMDKHGSPRPVKFDPDVGERMAIKHAAKSSMDAAVRLGASNWRERPLAFRTWLLLEEVAEMAQAAADGDLIAFADGLADVLYVLVGTAVKFDLPLARLFEEVHRSNMTKSGAKEGGTGRGKGASYSPPDIAGVPGMSRLLGGAE